MCMLTCVDVNSSCIYKVFYVCGVDISDLDGVLVLRLLCYDCLFVDYSWLEHCVELCVLLFRMIVSWVLLFVCY